MKRIKYERELSFNNDISITPCPYGYTKKDKIVRVGSITCTECNFIKKHNRNTHVVKCIANKHVKRLER